MQRSKQQWLALIDEQQSSRLSIAKFCDQKSINLKYFYARRSDFKSHQKTDAKFVRASIDPAPTSPVPQTCIVIQRGRASVRLPADIGTHRLVELIQALA